MNKNHNPILPKPVKQSSLGSTPTPSGFTSPDNSTGIFFPPPALIFYHSTHTIGARQAGKRSPAFYGLAAQEKDRHRARRLRLFDNLRESLYRLLYLRLVGLLALVHQSASNANVLGKNLLGHLRLDQPV